jgi:hypothetical protein
MKKLTQAFLWTCTALLLGQFCILGIAAAKGHLSGDTLTYIVATLSGIDIKSQHIGDAIRDAKATPVPTAQEILQARINAALDSDSKMASLNRLERELFEKSRLLDQEKVRLAELVAEHKRDVEARQASQETESLQKVSELIQALDPAEAKVQLAKMLERGNKEDVISILTGFDADKQRKVLAEFTEDKDREDLAKILEEIRSRGKAARK